MKMDLFRALKHTSLYYARAAMGMVIRPLKLRLAITNRCNSRCRMCSVWKLEGKQAEELTVEEYERTFSRSRGFLSRVRHVSLTGGEPLLRDDVADVVRVVHRHFPNASLNLNTNGFLTRRLLDLAATLADEGIAVTYNVSLDAFDEIHDRMRGVPRAAKMALDSINGLRELKEQGKKLKVNINCMIMDENAAACEEVYDFCRGHRLDFNPIMPVFGELYKNEDLTFSMSDKARARLTRLFEKMVRDSDGRQMSFAVVLDQILGRPREFRCWAGRIILLIEENGDVYPNGGCPRDWVLGNLRSFDYGLEKLFSSDQAREVLRRVRRCRRCRLPCETLTTLKYPEALHAYLKTRRTRAAQRRSTKRGAR